MIVTGSVALGGALSLAPRESSVAYHWGRRVVVLLAAGLALFDLLPEAFADVGWWCVLGLLIPLLLGQLEHRAMDNHSDRVAAAGFGLGFLAVLLHAVIDGAVIGLLSHPPIERTQQFGILIAESAHVIAITAAVCLRWRERAGVAAARARAVAIELAAIAGVAASQPLAGAADGAFTPWIHVIVAGVLLHVAAHQLHRPGCEHKAV